MDDNQISIIEISKIHSRYKQSIFKLIKRLGIESTKEVTSESRGQKVSFISKDDYQLLKNELADIKEISIVPSASGYFYLIQLEPETG